MTNQTFALVVALAIAACVDPSPAAQPQSPPPAPGESLFVTEISAQWRLPERLHEISGLAASGDGRVFANDDERALIYELDPATGAQIKSFSVGEGRGVGDFEALAITPSGEFWLATSQGGLYRFREGTDGAHVRYAPFDSGLGAICEIEGLAFLPAEESLILACKQNNASDMRDRVLLYLWSQERGLRAWLDLPEEQIAAAAGERHFRPSSVEVDPTTGRILVLSARDAILAELDANGALVTARELEGQHRQPEGLAVLPNGAIVVADEGADADAKLTRYDRAP